MLKEEGMNIMQVKEVKKAKETLTIYDTTSEKDNCIKIRSQLNHKMKQKHKYGVYL